jgi:hypothetical protein
LEWWQAQTEERRQGMRGGLRGGDLASGPASMSQQMAREAEILAAWKASQTAEKMYQGRIPSWVLNYDQIARRSG